MSAGVSRIPRRTFALTLGVSLALGGRADAQSVAGAAGNKPWSVLWSGSPYAKVAGLVQKVLKRSLANPVRTSTKTRFIRSKENGELLERLQVTERFRRGENVNVFLSSRHEILGIGGGLILEQMKDRESGLNAQRHFKGEGLEEYPDTNNYFGPVQRYEQREVFPSGTKYFTSSTLYRADVGISSSSSVSLLRTGVRAWGFVNGEGKMLRVTEISKGERVLQASQEEFKLGSSDVGKIFNLESAEKSIYNPIRLGDEGRIPVTHANVYGLADAGKIHVISLAKPNL